MEMAPQAPAPRWGGSLLLVLLVHAVVIVLALYAGGPVPTPSPASAEAIMVDIAPAPESALAERSEIAPGPPQPAREAVASRSAPTPAARPQAAPLPALPAQRDAMDPMAAPTPASPAPSSSALATAPPGAHEATAQRNAATQALAGTTREAMVTWQAQVLGHLERYKQYPRAAQRRRQEGTVQVRYTVDRQGVVLDAVLAASSGRDALDAEAVAAVRRASPLPRPPAEIPGEAIDVTTPVSFRLPRS